ncbi:MAG: hypothetical protein KGN01_06485 [Patescibacteria group bacterium]|nr:hypothetical protein [Patescibacteria group bacterium]
MYSQADEVVDPERLYGGQATSRLVFGNALGSPHETRNSDGSSEMYNYHGGNGRFVTRVESKKLQDILGTKTWAVINSPLTREMTMKKTEEKNTIIGDLKKSITSGEKFTVQHSEAIKEHLSKDDLSEDELEDMVRYGRLQKKSAVSVVKPMKDEEISQEYEVFIDFAEKLLSEIQHFKHPLDSRKAKNPLIARPGKRRYGAKFVREEYKRMKLEKRLS